MSENKENAPQEQEKDTVQQNSEPVWDEVPETEKKEPEPELTEEEKLKADLAALQEKFIYLQAEYQNYRKRAARDISDARSHAIADTLTPFLAVSDFLGMAQTAAEKTDNLDAIKQGLMMIIAQFDKALEEMSVRKFSAIGEKFDPDLHDAVGREPSETVPEGVVTKEWNCGYKIGEKLLRPARVMVSSGPDVPAENDPAENDPADKE
ncbi:MAG: nucleotide exchange factor GrpE [Lentisphaerae bacterium]|nr:nucleotide exchange factor GrpE [Lentisphaerota bacterium]